MSVRICLLLAACSLGGACTRARAGGVSDAAGSKSVAAEDGATPAARAALLQTKLSALAKESDGIFAVTVMHLPSGAVASVNGGRRLPMMSVFKLPLAIVTLAAIDDGARTMSDPILLTQGEIRSFVSPVADGWKRGETSPSLETLLRTAVQESDNTSGDKLVTMNGGGPAITARLRKMGIDGIDIAEEEIDISARIVCAGTTRPKQGWTEAAMARCTKASPEGKAAAAKVEIDASPNGATTDALVAMLAKIDRGEILSGRARTWLTTTLEGTRTGPGRIKGDLPEGTTVAHKTGTGETIDGATIARNDVGTIALPDGSRLAIAVLTAGTRGELAVCEARKAKAARAAWDAFVH